MIDKRRRRKRIVVSMTNISKRCFSNDSPSCQAQPSGERFVSSITRTLLKNGCKKAAGLTGNILRIHTYFSFPCKHYLQKDKGEDQVKATGIMRRIDDLGRVVIPKEIRRTMRIREGDPLLMTLTNDEIFILGVLKLGERMGIR